MKRGRRIESALSNYRYSGPAVFPSYIQDAARAVGWMYHRSREYGIDSRKVYIGGISAGAYLAAMLAMDANTTGWMRMSPNQGIRYEKPCWDF